MKKAIGLLLMLALLVPVASHGKVMVLCSKTAAHANSKYINACWSRMVEVLGVKDYVVYDPADTVAVEAAAAGGDYALAIAMNLPELSSSFDSDAEIATAGWGNLGMWVDAGSVNAFPIPLVMLLPTNMTTTNSWASAYTGQISSTVRATGTPADATALWPVPRKTANGDSLYVYMSWNGNYEALVAEADSSGFSFSTPLVWRYTSAREAVNTKYASMWVTTGTGNHKVFWIPYASKPYNVWQWASVIAAYEPITPIECPFNVLFFGQIANLWHFGTDADTTSLGLNLKTIKDYAVANDIKIDFNVEAYWLDYHAAPSMSTDLIASCAAHPNNLRMSHLTTFDWDDQEDWLNAAGSTYTTMTRRIADTFDSTEVHLPTAGISETRIVTYLHYFTGPDPYAKLDTVLLALTASGVTDVQSSSNQYSAAMPPSNLKMGVFGPRRMWIATSPTQTSDFDELRMHSKGLHARYRIQFTNQDDSLRCAYLNYARMNNYRSRFMGEWPAYTLGMFCHDSGGQMNLEWATYYMKVARNAILGFGWDLPPMTLTGGVYDLAGVDATRSLFLDLLKGYVEQRNAAQYIIDTYGTQDQALFIPAFWDECKYDRRNGNAFANSHVTVE